MLCSNSCFNRRLKIKTTAILWQSGWVADTGVRSVPFAKLSNSIDRTFLNQFPGAEAFDNHYVEHARFVAGCVGLLAQGTKRIKGQGWAEEVCIEWLDMVLATLASLDSAYTATCFHGSIKLQTSCWTAVVGFIAIHSFVSDFQVQCEAHRTYLGHQQLHCKTHDE